ncbi:hypothetical protein [Komagataeibacter xylinus]|uniref:hypothetical protein n=1 Tax=Komagataeibacter xylinus TaxID=28448 RepID=UPI00280AE012|nr:hypothetical protein [Komagataeibacter xylinus]
MARSETAQNSRAKGPAGKNLHFYIYYQFVSEAIYPPSKAAEQPSPQCMTHWRADSSAPAASAGLHGKEFS